MDEGQVLRRMLAAMTGIHFQRFRHPECLTPVDMTRVEEAQKELRQFPVWIEFPRSLNIQQLVSRARIAKQRHSVEFVGLDYLQKMEFTTDKPEQQYAAVGYAAKQLANLVKHEGMVVLALSSLTEKSGRTKDSEPSMLDIRQSGDVQNEAGSMCCCIEKVPMRRTKASMSVA